MLKMRLVMATDYTHGVSVDDLLPITQWNVIVDPGDLHTNIGMVVQPLH